MTERALTRVAIVVGVGIAVLIVATGCLLFGPNRRVVYANDLFLWALFSATAMAFVVAGLAIVRRWAAHSIGWLCLLTAAALEVSLFLTQYGIYALVITPDAGLPMPALGLALAEPLPILYVVGLILIGLLFPTGHPLTPRWRWAIWATVAGYVASVGRLLEPHRITDIWSDELSHAGASAANPLGIEALRGINDIVGPIGGVLVAAGALAAVASLFLRRRRATTEERLQIRWLTFVAGAAVVWIVLVLPIVLWTDPEGVGIASSVFWSVITPLLALGPPIAIGIGIVRYRLFDIDVVVRKTVVVAVIAFTLTVLYLGVVTLATLAPVSRALVAILLLLLTFNPIRRAARSIGNRVAYGKRASSYEVLSDFSERIAETYAADDVLPRMAGVLATGTGAETATVWLRVGGELRPVATVGEPVTRAEPITGDTLPDLGGREAIEIRQAGELLGALSIVMPANDPIDPARRSLLQDMAAQAGLVLRNARLIEELRASRQRLVAAQDEERRKIERNLHDGVQQQLVALNIQLGLLGKVSASDPAKTADLATALQSQATAALEDLRDLARGIYPPLLADKGLAAALEAQARKAAVPTDVEVRAVERYSRDVEATIYFCALEALNNVAKYAEAAHATIALGHDDGHVTFEVRDDGNGFDPASTTYGTGLQGMADRLDAVGGTLVVTSEPGAGTTVTGVVPVHERSSSD